MMMFTSPYASLPLKCHRELMLMLTRKDGGRAEELVTPAPRSLASLGLERAGS